MAQHRCDLPDAGACRHTLGPMWTSASKIGGTPGASYLRRRRIWGPKKWPESVRWIGHRVGIRGLPEWSAGCVVYGYTDEKGVVASVDLEALDKDGGRGDELRRGRWRRHRGRNAGCAFRVGSGRACIFVVPEPETALVLGTQHRDATMLATANGDAGYADIAQRLRDVTVPVKVVVPPNGDVRLATEAAAVCRAVVVRV